MKAFDHSLLHYVHGAIEVSRNMCSVRNKLQRKYNCLGHGAYAHVFDLGDYVLKVGTELHDDGFPDYVDFTHEHLEYADHMPNVVYHEEFPEMDGFITVMPKLLELEDNTDMLHLWWMLENIYDSHYLVDINMQIIRSIILERAQDYSLRFKRPVKYYIKLARENVKMFQLMHEIALIAENEGYALDIHSGNFMVNPHTNKLILTDPWCR